MMIFILEILYLVGNVWCTSDNDTFYPFGLNHGDQILQRNDDKSSGVIPTGIDFPFFNQYFSELYVSMNFQHF